MVAPLCPKCGSTIKVWDKFCSTCGGILPDLSNCLQCGSVIDLTAKFCPKCGQPAAPVAVPQNSSAHSLSSPEHQLPPEYGHEDKNHKDINIPWYVEGGIAVTLLMLLRRCY